jgi:hypothetical protein
VSVVSVVKLMPLQGRLPATVFFLALLFPVTKAAYYTCTESVECSSTYGAPTVGTEADMEVACTADASCVAFQYNAGAFKSQFMVL